MAGRQCFRLQQGSSLFCFILSIMCRQVSLVIRGQVARWDLKLSFLETALKPRVACPGQAGEVVVDVEKVAETASKAGSSLPFEPITLVFKDLRYFVDAPKGMDAKLLAGADSSHPGVLELLKVGSPELCLSKRGTASLNVLRILCKIIAKSRVVLHYCYERTCRDPCSCCTGACSDQSCML